MSTSASSLLDFQPSDYNATDIGLQDYSSFDTSSLAAPTFDTPMGVDPFSGTSLFDGSPADPSLTQVMPDASAGMNAFDIGLLPLSNPNPVSDAVIADSQNYGAGLDLFSNLPLTQPDSGILTQLGRPTAAPFASSKPMGASLWASLFGAGTAVALHAAGAGTSGTVAPQSGGISGIKAAPLTAIRNPISGMNTALIIGVAAALIGAVIWSFSGAR